MLYVAIFTYLPSSIKSFLDLAKAWQVYIFS
jgi:hypothetical protein